MYGVLATGIDFGPDGALYLADWIQGWDTKDHGRIWKLDVNNPNTQERKQTQDLLAANFSAGGATNTEGRLHFWRYYDLTSRKIIDNRYQIMQLIACAPDTPRFPPPYHEVDVFAMQERVIESILGEVEQQEVVNLVNKPVAEEQTTVAQILQTHLNHPNFKRKELQQLRQFLKQPLVGASVRQLRQALQSYSLSNDVAALIEVVKTLYAQQGEIEPPEAAADKPVIERLTREDLKLICYEYIYA
jgi:hypothetical protein